MSIPHGSQTTVRDARRKGCKNVIVSNRNTQNPKKKPKP